MALPLAADPATDLRCSQYFFDRLRAHLPGRALALRCAGGNPRWRAVVVCGHLPLQLDTTGAGKMAGEEAGEGCIEGRPQGGRAMEPRRATARVAPTLYEAIRTTTV